MARYPHERGAQDLEGLSSQQGHRMWGRSVRLRALCGESTRRISSGLGLSERDWAWSVGAGREGQEPVAGHGAWAEGWEQWWPRLPGVGGSTVERGGPGGGRPGPGARRTAATAMQKQCQTGPGWSSPSPLLSGQVNNATARVMTNKKTANPYTNGKGPRTSGRPQGPWAQTQALQGPRPLEAPLPGC